VPLVAVGPAQLGATFLVSEPARVDMVGEVVEDLVGRDDGDEEAHRCCSGA
jgi:hypothetical protein